MPKKLRYGNVEVQYRDTRKKVVLINNVNNVDVDTLDEVAVNVNSLRYQINGEKQPIDYNDYIKIISGDGWYILISKECSIESGVLNGNSENITEYNKYLSMYNGSKENTNNVRKVYIKKLTPIKSKEKIGDGI